MPNKWESDYNRMIALARQRVAGGNGKMRTMYLDMYRVLAESLLRLNNDIASGRISDIRGVRMRRAFQEMAENLGADFTRIIKREIEDSVELIKVAHEEAIRNASAITGVAVNSNITVLVDDALESSVIRKGLIPEYNYRTLINRGISDLKDDINRLISSGIARGVAPEQLGKELAVMMSRNDQEFQAVLRNLGPRGGRLANSMKEIDPKDLTRAKNLLFDARRIAVTEVANAYHEADRIASVESEVVAGMKWQVSGRHYGLPTSPDSCTFLHETDQYGLGAGVFYPETCPSLQHPFCACYTLKTFRDPVDWGTPKEEPSAPKMYDERGLRRFFKGKTANFRERQTDRINRLNQLAYDSYKGNLVPS